MGIWGSFFQLMGGAAATLIGLMFVAVTFGQKLVTPETERVARCLLGPIFFHFGHVLFLSCVALMPLANTSPFGISAAILAALRLANLPFLARLMQKVENNTGEIETIDWIFAILLPAVFYVLCLLGGSALYLHAAEWGLYFINISLVGVLFLGILAAWDMLIWMAAKLE
jgi:hypothetical protein